MATRVVLSAPAYEGGSYYVTATIVDETGTAIPSTTLATLVLTLYDRETGTIINSVSQTNILNTGRGTVSATGELTITLTPADNALVTSAKAREQHVMLVEWTYPAGGAKAGKQELEFSVDNIAKTIADGVIS